MSEDHGGAHGGTWSAPPHLCPSTGRNNAQLFTAAAERVTRLYKSPDRNHFCMAANAVTALYREQEAEVVRAQHRGARESLRQCLQWVTQQGPIVDAGQLAQLLKGQIEVHSIATQAGCGPSEDTPSRLVDHELVAAEGVAEDSSLQGLLSPERSTVAGGTAMEETPEAGARKRRAGDDAFLLEDERLLQALPAVWPGRKMARRSVTMSMEPKLPILHSD